MGWEVRHPYVYGGVIWYSDTPGAYNFSTAWHRNWLLNVKETGRLRDQPALNFSLHSTDIDLAVLDHSWNAQTRMRSNLAKDAFIWHTYSSADFCSQDRFMTCCLQVQKDPSRSLPYKAISRLIKASSPDPRFPQILKLRRQLKRILKSVIFAIRFGISSLLK